MLLTLKSLSAVGRLSSSESLEAIASLERMSERKVIGPPSLDVCVSDREAKPVVALPLCNHEAVSYRYAHQFLKLCFAQKDVGANHWFAFFSCDQPGVVRTCLSQARLYNAKRSLQLFMSGSQWRRRLLRIMEGAVKRFDSSRQGKAKFTFCLPQWKK